MDLDGIIHPPTSLPIPSQPCVFLFLLNISMIQIYAAHILTRIELAAELL